MKKFVSRFVGMLMCLALLSSMAACLAETETDTYTTYTRKDAAYHTVTEETWEYPIIDGERGSGKPVGSEEYDEKHTFDGGECIYCGAEETKKAVTESADEDSDDETTTTAEVAEETTIITALGVELTAGEDAASVLTKVFASLPADFTITGVDSEIADRLISLLGSGAVDPQQLMEILKQFPIQMVDGRECYVVTLHFGNTTENFAFSTADGALVKVF